MLIQSTSVRVPFKATSSLGVNVTGLGPSDFLNSSIQVVRADGSTLLVSLVASGMGQNLFEIDQAQSPGLYHILLPSSATSLVGQMQYTINPAASLFQSVVYLNEVVNTSTSDSLLAITQYLYGTQKIDTSSRLTIYQPDGITPLVCYYLLDENSQPSIFNIRQKVKI